MDLLPDNILAEIFEYIGPEHSRDIITLSRQLWIRRQIFYDTFSLKYNHVASLVINPADAELFNEFCARVRHVDNILYDSYRIFPNLVSLDLYADELTHLTNFPSSLRRLSMRSNEVVAAVDLPQLTHLDWFSPTVPQLPDTIQTLCIMTSVMPILPMSLLHLEIDVTLHDIDPLIINTLPANLQTLHVHSNNTPAYIVYPPRLKTAILREGVINYNLPNGIVEVVIYRIGVDIALFPQSVQKISMYGEVGLIHGVPASLRQLRVLRRNNQQLTVTANMSQFQFCADNEWLIWVRS